MSLSFPAFTQSSPAQQIERMNGNGMDWKCPKVLKLNHFISKSIKCDGEYIDMTYIKHSIPADSLRLKV